jgi:hypothetical protein
MIAVNRGSLDATPIWGHNNISPTDIYDSIPDPPINGRRLVSADITQRLIEHCQVPNIPCVLADRSWALPLTSVTSTITPPTSSTFMLYTASRSPQFIAALQRMRGGTNLQKLREACDKSRSKNDVSLEETSTFSEEPLRTEIEPSSSCSSSSAIQSLAMDDSPEKGLTTTTVTLGRSIERRKSGTARSA